MMDTATSISPTQLSAAPAATPVSPCGSETSVASGLRRVEDDYDVDPRVLGAGHCGTVRGCTDRASGRRYAIKSVRKGDPAVRPGDLAREVALLREVHHPGLVRLVDVCEDADCVHIVTDLLEGGELSDRIAARKGDGGRGPCLMEEAEAARILRQVLAAVAHLHRRGIAHRDIKPGNVVFASAAPDAPVALVDLGLARRRDGRPHAPRMRARVGTPPYMAPEVLHRRHDGYDLSCDLWSVGAVAHALLAGRPPFGGRTQEEVLAAIRRRGWLSARRDLAGVSREGRDFVRRLLQKDPKKRMTAEQALEHPWILKHAGDGVKMSNGNHNSDASVEVVYRGSRSDFIVFGDIETHTVCGSNMR